MSESNKSDIQLAAKKWAMAAQHEGMPIDFDELWEMAGYTRRDNSVRAFGDCVRNFNLLEGLDFSSLKRESTGGRPTRSFKLSIRTAKRFLATAQTNVGFAIIDALIQAEEELQVIKANTAILINEALAPIVKTLEILVTSVNSVIERSHTQEQRLFAIEHRLNKGLGDRPSRKSEPVPIDAAMNETLALFRIRSDYQKAFGETKRRFNSVMANACRRFGYESIHRGGNLCITPEAVRDERVIAYVMHAQDQAIDRQDKIEPGFKARLRNRYRPALGQNRFSFN